MRHGMHVAGKLKETVLLLKRIRGYILPALTGKS
jgi:hypothetical protein